MLNAPLVVKIYKCQHFKKRCTEKSFCSDLGLNTYILESDPYEILCTYHKYAPSYLFESLLLTVTQKCPKKAAVEVIQYCNEEILIELESCRKLHKHTKTHFIYRD